MSVPEPREGADNIIPDTQYGMPSARYVEMLNEEGLNMSGPLDGLPPAHPILPVQATRKNPREME